MKLSKLVPDSCEPDPHGFDNGKPTAVSPDTTASRSSVKEILVALFARSKLVISNSSVVVPPGATGSSIKDFRRKSVVTVSTAPALPLDVAPWTRLLVVFFNIPADSAVTSTVIVQLEPAPTPPEVIETRLEPGVAFSVGVVVKKPLKFKQSLKALAGSATTIPLGKLSLKDNGEEVADQYDVPLA